MRTVVLAAVASIALTGCAASPPASEAAPSCGPVPAADFTTPDGWIGFLAANPEKSSVVIADGDDTTVSHDGDTDRPLASAVKIVHLGAYARAVADGTLDPNESVPVSEWQRWFVPGTDGGAHIAALTRLGIANDGTSPLDPAATVRLDDMVTAMIQESDNGVPDYLRYRLGDDALVDAAGAGGWTGFEVPTLIGNSLASFQVPQSAGDPWEVAQRWAFDDAFRVEFSTAAATATPDQFAWYAENGAMGSADDLTAVYGSIADGSYGPGLDDVRRILEYLPAPDGLTGVGFKGGNLPGALTHAWEFRDGDTGTTVVWLISGLNEAEYAETVANIEPFQTLMIDAGTDPSTQQRIACAV